MKRILRSDWLGERQYLARFRFPALVPQKNVIFLSI